NADSILKKLIFLNALPDTNFLASVPLKKQFGLFSTKSFLKPGSGYLNYNWHYRTGIDTPFVENNISQHLLTGSFNATLANMIPLRITYFERRSNSHLFRDFRDIRVELNVPEFQKIKADQLRKYLAGLSNQ